MTSIELSLGDEARERPLSTVAGSGALVLAWRLLRAPELLLLAGAPGGAWLLEAPALDPLRATLFAAGVLALGAHVMTANTLLGRRTWEADSAAMDFPLAGKDWRPRLVAAVSSVALGLSLLLFGFLSPPSSGVAALLAALWILYAHPGTRWKGIPFLDTSIHVASGLLLYGLGLAATSGRPDLASTGWAGVFTLLLVGGHFHHVIKDREADEDAGIETVGRRIGVRSSLAAGTACFGVAHLLVVLLASKALGPVGAAGASLLALSHAALAADAAPKILGGSRSALLAYRARYRILSLGIGVLVLATVLERLAP